MNTTLIDKIAKLTKLEKLELIRYLIEDALRAEIGNDFELSDDQKVELEQYWVEIKNGTTEPFTGEEIRRELKERYGIVSVP